jgi:hypothetical protein
LFRYPGSHAPKKQVLYARGSYGATNDAAAFDRAYTDASWGSETVIVGRECANCQNDMRSVYYKRISDPPALTLPYKAFVEQSFALTGYRTVYEYYTSLADAIKGNNKLDTTAAQKTRDYKVPAATDFEISIYDISNTGKINLTEAW